MQSPAIEEPLTRLASFLAARGHRVVIDSATVEDAPLPGYRTAPAEALGREAQLAIVIGGDGTMLSIARRLAPFDVPLIGINQGRLGFLTDIALADMETTLDAMLAGRYVEETRTLLDATLTRTSGSTENALALNDVVVNRGGLGGMIDCSVTLMVALSTRCAPTDSYWRLRPARPHMRCPPKAPLSIPACPPCCSCRWRRTH